MTSKHYTFTCLFSFTIITFVLNKQKNKSLFTIHGEFRIAILQTFQLLVNFLIVNYDSTMTILNFQQLNICRRVQIKQLKFAFFSFPIHSWLLSMELNGEWAEEKLKSMNGRICNVLSPMNEMGTGHIARSWFENPFHGYV